MADLCSHCLEIEAALAERDREIERLREREDWIDPRLLTICEHKHYIRMADDTYAELDRLRSREAKWRELVRICDLLACVGDELFPYSRERAPQLRRELGLDGENQ